MGAFAILPRIIGQGRAADLLFTGRSMSADEGDRWGFHNRIVDAGSLLAEAQAYAANLANGPTFAHGLTKNQLEMEWAMPVETAIRSERRRGGEECVRTGSSRCCA